MKDFKESYLLEKFKELKKDLLIESNEEYEIIRQKDEYTNMKFKEIDETVEGGLSYFYMANVYLLEKIKVSEEQLKKLELNNPILRYEKFLINVGNTWGEIYFETDNFNCRNITDKLIKYIDICKENNYEFEVNVNVNGNGNGKC